MSLGPWQIILVIILVVLLFGRGKISQLMGDVAKGIKSFKKGIADDDHAPTAEDARTINAEAQPTQTPEAEKTQTS